MPRAIDNAIGHVISLYTNERQNQTKSFVDWILIMVEKRVILTLMPILNPKLFSTAIY